MARYYGIYFAVSETISRRDGAWNLSGGSKNSSAPIGSNESYSSIGLGDIALTGNYGEIRQEVVSDKSSQDT
jgi:hypothetical protein